MIFHKTHKYKQEPMILTKIVNQNNRLFNNMDYQMYKG